jgi:hypothetical protein
VRLILSVGIFLEDNFWDIYLKRWRIKTGGRGEVELRKSENELELQYQKQ